jgi:hypothetical protein
MVERGKVGLLWPMARSVGELRFAASPEYRLSRSNRRGVGQREVNARAETILLRLGQSSAPPRQIGVILDGQRDHGSKTSKNAGCR